MKLFDFSDPNTLAGWQVILDQVMGGCSQATFQPQQQAAEFRGDISLANNGGFASLRSPTDHFDLSDAAGLKLRCRGDQKIYKLTLRLEKNFDGISWQSRFELSGKDWEEIDLPFDTFRPTWHGRPVTHPPPFDPAQIACIGLLIGDGQEGSFWLEVDSLDTLSPGDAA